MKILRALLLLGLVGVCARGDVYANEQSSADTTPHDDSQHWKFLETPGTKRKNPKTPTRPFVSGGGQAWKSRLRR